MIYFVPLKALPFYETEGIVAKDQIYGQVKLQRSCEISNILKLHNLYITATNKICQIPSDPESDLKNLFYTKTGHIRPVPFINDTYLFNRTCTVLFTRDGRLDETMLSFY